MSHFIGIIAENSPQLPIGLLGILKSGNAFVPINPTYPPERIRFIIMDCHIYILLTDKANYEKSYEIAAASPALTHLICLDNGTVDTFEKKRGTTPVTPQKEETCYVIYTSGSTGKPKGVPIRHCNLIPLFYYSREYLHLGGHICVMQNLSYTFDFGVFEIFTTLLFGGRFYVLNKSTIGDFSQYAYYINRWQINTLHTTPVFLNNLAGAGQKIPFIKCIHLGGEQLTGKVVQETLKVISPGCMLYNGYGPTEATINCTFFSLTTAEMEANVKENIPIGHPCDRHEIYILNRYFNPQPIGTAGELCIAGPGLSRGYLNRPELTAEKFIFSPNFLTSSLPNFPLYRTGDLARWFPDGNMEFLGRIDQQVKVRGYRIELGEIENHLSRHPAVKETVVMVREHENGGNGNGNGGHYLCAYIVYQAAANPTVSQWREFLAASLPDYMIPAYFIHLESIPLTHSGKIDKKALPGPDETFSDTASEYIPPVTETGKKLAAIWQDLLAIKRIGIMDNFFEFGGDSILVNRCIARIREEMQVEIPLRKFFERPYIKALTEEIAKQDRQVSTIKPAERQGELPLSFAQERLWFLQELDAANVAYFVPRVIRMKGKLDISLIERTFTEIIRRHEILRTVFPNVDGQPVQRIQPPYEFKIPVLDWCRLEMEEQERQIAQFLSAEGQRPFNFEHGPLLRVTLIKLQDQEHFFVLTEHHLVHDGWTQGVLLNEFIAIFTAYANGSGHGLPDLPIQYADYAIWQRNYLKGAVLEQHLHYWKEKLKGLASVLELPADRPRPPIISGQGALEEFRLSAAFTHHLKKFSRQNGVTLYMTMLAVFKTLLYRYTGVGDLCVGMGIANRRFKEMEGMLGMVINTLPLRTQIQGEISFNECLYRVKETCLEAYLHEDTPFGKIVEALQPERSLSYSPLFQVLFTFMNTPRGELQLPGLELELLPSHNRSAKFDINVVLVPPPEQDAGAGDETGEILVEWEYNTDIFTASTVKRMIAHYQRLLAESIAKIETNLSALPLVSEAEMKQVLYEYNDTSAVYPREKTIHQLFVEQAEKSPDSVGLVGDVGHVRPVGLTYRQLNEQSEKLAGLLIEKGVLPDHIVAIMMERSVEMISGIMGILKSGGAYLPIDPEYPQERIDYMLSDSGAKILINEKFFRGFRGAILQKSPPVSTNLAYIIYTSGTTGQPKGTLIEHRNVVRLLFNDKFQFDFTPNDTWTMFHSYCFDFSVWEMYGALLYGGKLLIVPKMMAKDTMGFLGFLSREVVSVLNQTPSAFYNLINGVENARQEVPLFTKYIIFGGEALNPLKLKDWLKKYPQTRFINMFGITETTVHVTYKEINEQDAELSISNIGKPIPTLSVYILDRDLKPVPVGLMGEIFVGGDGVGRGYLNRVELTAEKFIKNPYRSGDRLYRSGDTGRFRENGDIEYLGRIDHQVKIRGFRIELGEIESELAKHNDIKDAVVISQQNETSENYLCAYIVPALEHQLSIPGLREYLGRRLPDYMLPAYFVYLERIPLNPNGKVDRGALPGPELKSGENYTAPRDEMEKKLIALWADILSATASHSLKLQTSIGIDDNFFQLGGHSLKAALLAARIEKTFNVKIPLAEIFKNPTVRAFAKYIKDAVQSQYEQIALAEKKEYYVLSSAQKRLYFLQQMDPEGTAYNISAMMILDGVVDKNKLEQSIWGLIWGHESLRTAFVAIGEEPVQRIYEQVSFAIEYNNPATDVPGVPGAAGVHGQTRPPVGGSLLKFIQPFDLSQAPLLRVGLIKLAEEKCIFLVDLHHIISDGMSIHVLVQDFSILYAGQELPPIKLCYKDYAEWQNHEKKSKKLKEQEIFWQEEFAGEIPVLDLLTDYARPTVQGFAGAYLPFQLSSEISGRLKTAALEVGGTLYITLLAIYTIFLAKISGREDIVVGTPVAGRRHADLENIIGMFVNTLALRNYPAGEKICADFLEEVKKRTLKVFENQDYPYEDLVEKVFVNRDVIRNPLFDTMFVLQNTGAHTLEIPGLKMTPYPQENKTAKFDLSLTAEEIGDNLAFNFNYSTRLFNRETILRFISYFKNTTADVMADKNKPIAAVQIIPSEEKKRILADFNQTATGYTKDKTIHELFAAQAEKTPDRMAVSGAGGAIQITYRHLDEQSGRLAGVLSEKGARPDQIVGIMAERSPATITGILAILKSGGAYLAIDPGFPKERIDYILKDSGAKMLIRRAEKEGGGEIVFINFFPASSLPCFLASNSSNLAYIIYTSGSTGKPKGVAVEHGNVIRLVENPTFIEAQEGQRLLLTGTFTFDIVIFEIWWPLLNGLSVYLADKNTLLDPVEMGKQISMHRIDILHLVPQLFKQLFTHNPGIFAGLRYFLVGGDRVPPRDIEQLRNRYEKLKILHMYGPTEGTIFTTYLEVNQVVENDRSLPIGGPVNNTSVYILGRRDELLPIGVAGQLCAGGAGIARGYLNQPDLTAEKFRPLITRITQMAQMAQMTKMKNKINKSFAGGKGELFQKRPLAIYKTGDLARWLNNGHIEFLGRMDNQVKIRGVRIELGEIESILATHEAVKEAVVMIVSNQTGENYICAYIVLHPERQVYEPGLREYLGRQLTDYMIPSYFVQLEKIPVTAHGKIDRGALPAPGVSGVSGGESYTAPGNEMERKLVELWAEVLARDPLHASQLQTSIGIYDNFFQWGGHSLKFMVLAAKIHKVFHVKIPLPEIFKMPRFKEMAEYIKGKSKDLYISIEPAEEKEYYPLSSAQKRLYVLQQMGLDSTAYNMPGIIPLPADSDPVKIKGAFKKLIERHESLRTSFHMINDTPVQKIHKKFETEVFGSTFFQKGGPPEAILKNFICPFDLSQAPLLRAGLAQNSDGGYMLLVDMHHIISDAVSHEILALDFTRLYRDQGLPALRLAYKDYSEWQNRLAQTNAIKKQEEYWLAEFRGQTTLLDMPLDYERTSEMHFQGSSICFEIDAGLTARVKKCAARFDVTLMMFLLAVYNILLAACTCREEVIVGTVTAGRRHADLQNIIGFFVNMLAIKTYPGQDKTFSQYLPEVKEKALNAFENQEYPFDELVGKLGIQREPGRHPFVDVVFVFRDENNDGVETGVSALDESLVNPMKISHFDLMFHAMDRGESISVVIEYSTSLFKSATIEGLASGYREILAQVTANNDIRLADIEISHHFLVAKSDFIRADNGDWEI